MEFKDYFETTYASWLGKIIGIRLGAPIEGWEYKEILKTFGEINYYPVDYGVFAADDDSNGPLFFVKALEDDSDDPLLTKMSNTVLNYINDGHGFFWWGGDGISTEHTAYNNLKKGMIAPVSGSFSTNGEILSTQIGGQIFSDCWGYVSVGDPKLASYLSKSMASVTHDLDGIEGASFIASAISIAYSETEINVVIDKALEFVDKKSNYYSIVLEIKEFHNLYPNDYKKCLDYILQKHNYSVYGGVCPIISNTALMIMAMLYGESNFDKTMSILATAGWDTDCNLGNVGSIMGALVGLKGIDEKWINPINDLLLSSSSIGSLNIDTITNTAFEFCKLGYKLKEKAIPYEYNSFLDSDYKNFVFYFPYSTQSFKTIGNRYSETSLKVEKNKLKVIVNNGYKDNYGYIYQKTYYKPSEIYDSRYEPSFSPTIYPNETIFFSLENPENISFEACIYVKDDKGFIYNSDYLFVENNIDLIYKIDKSINIVSEYGIKIKYNLRITRSYFYISNVKVKKGYDYNIDFKNQYLEDWGLDFVEKSRITISQLVNVYGNIKIIDSKLVLNKAMVTFSDYKSSISNIEVDYEYTDDVNFLTCFSVKGNNVYQAIKITKDNVSYIIKKNSVFKEIYLGKISTNQIKINSRFTLNINVKYGNIVVSSDNRVWFKVNYNNLICDNGCCAIINNIEDELSIYNIGLKAKNGGKR
ncbi:MAG: ADP-ribosylglycohydrolase family protein [Erysipelotrichaceae bacterium]|nr:ADP-ribosylglycohydrolase family protein [Erysipelotrichaceae bacterium]